MNILRACFAELVTNTYVFNERKWEKERKREQRKQGAGKEEGERQGGKKGGLRELGDISPKCNGFRSPLSGILVSS